MVLDVKWGEVIVDGKGYFSDVIVWWNGKVDYRIKSHILSLKDAEELARGKPEVVIIGRGVEHTVKLDEGLRGFLKERGIDVFVDNSSRACKLFNAFQAQGKKVVAVIHST